MSARHSVVCQVWKKGDDTLYSLHESLDELSAFKRVEKRNDPELKQVGYPYTVVVPAVTFNKIVGSSSAHGLFFAGPVPMHKDW